MFDLRPYRSLHAIQLIRELLRRWYGLELALSDARGYVLDHGDGQIFPSKNEFCRQALFSREGFKRCNESVRYVGELLRLGRGGAPAAPADPAAPTAFVHQCHLGFDVIAAPVWVRGELAGFVFTGGSWKEPPPPAERGELLRRVREFAAMESDAADDHAAGVPRLGAPELAHLKDLIAYGAGEIAKVLAARSLREVADAPGHPFTEIVGASPAVRDVARLLAKVVRSESTVLIHGESGTGKELVARAIHFHGPRAKAPFVVQNCSAFNDNLLESALFGHVRGAFTGAVRDQKGLFEVADGGTFFLDEIGDMSPALQVKLLRVLQEGTFTPVGGTRPVKVDVRIVAASHKDLAAMVARREFREDLFYRVNVIKVSLPPLRDRVGDLPVLAEHFLRKHWRPPAGEPGRPPPVLADATLEAMARYAWPGNIRELENEIERMLVLGGDEARLEPSLLSARMVAGVEPAGARPAAAATANEAASGPIAASRRATAETGTLREQMERVEAELIQQGLIRTHWNKSQLAKELGVSRSYLIQKCAEYGLERKE